jgi:MFS family permease
MEKNENIRIMASTKIKNSEAQANEGSEIVKKDSTNIDPPFPYLPVSFSCLGMLAHSVAFTSPLPFVAFMIVDFHMTDNLDEAGYTAGWITGMFMVGRAMAGIPWGMAADRFGRKTCLCLSMFNVFFLNILFGFSTNFYMAATSRFLLGLGNGFMAISKTYISEVVQCREHEMRGLGYVNAFWGLGMIIGPAIGGTLARPAVQYPHLFSATGIWGRFPYLLPSIVGSLFALAAALGILFFANETLKVKSTGSKNSNQTNKTSSKYSLVGKEEEEEEAEKEEEGDIEMNRLQIKQHTEEQELEQNDPPSQKKKKTSSLFSFAASSSASASHEYSKVETISDDSVHNPIIRETNEEDDDEEELNNNQDIESNKNIEEAQSPTEGNRANEHANETIKPVAALPASFHEILHSKPIQNVFIVYTLYCFICMFFDETFPLFAVTSINNGGLAWNAVETGQALAAVGLGLVIFQLFIFEHLMKKVFVHGPTHTLTSTTMIVAACMPLLPLLTDGLLRIWTHYHPHDASSNASLSSSPWMYAAVVFSLALYKMPSIMTFTTVSLVTNSLVDVSMRGTLNGLMMTAGRRSSHIEIFSFFCFNLFLFSVVFRESWKWCWTDFRICFVCSGD